MAALVTKSVAAENIFSDEVVLEPGEFNLQLSGTWVATVTVLRKFNDDATWYPVETFTENGAYVGSEPGRKVTYKVGVETGDYTSGTVVIRISQ